MDLLMCLSNFDTCFYDPIYKILGGLALQGV
jgi:hypothetical protein